MRFCKRNVTATFTLEYKTKFGEDIRVVGNVPELGAWDPEKAATMTWTPGHVWETTLPLAIPDEPLEYKYVLMDKGKVKAWEPIGNRAHHSEQLFGSSTLDCHNIWGKFEAVDRIPLGPEKLMDVPERMPSKSNLDAISGA